jgi:outer membrane protein TolC
MRRLFIFVCVLSVAGASYSQDLEDRLHSSVPSAPATPGRLSLSLRDAVDRAVKNNLASLIGREDERAANARRLQDRAELFPKLDAFVASEQRQLNLAALGFSGFPGINQVIGPFAFYDARATLSQPLLDFELRHNLRQSTEAQRAVSLGNANTRELVVLTAVDLYFRVVSSQSRVSAVEAQLARANALHTRAVDMKDAGVVPGIDVLRAQVEQRSLEQRLIQSRNIVQKDKLDLARVIGLPLEQDFTLTDALPMEGNVLPSLPQLIETAFARRSDYRATEARVRAAEENVKAARARKLPSLGVNADYGVNGRTPSNLHGTYSVRVEARMPIFDRNIDTEAEEREAALKQRQAERDSLRGRIEQEVRSALLDLQSEEERLRVARESLTLAQQQLDQAQDRFSAGVANNLEVVQAQEAVALNDEGVIQSLYGFNISRAHLARATGSAEQALSEFFQGSTK